MAGPHHYLKTIPRLLSQSVRSIALAMVATAMVWYAGAFLMGHVASRIGEGARRGEISSEAATHALHRMRDAAVPTLVRLATDPNETLARPARVALAARVDQWRAEASKNPRRFTRRTEHLLTAFQDAKGPLTSSTKKWAGRFTTSLLADVTLSVPIKRAMLLARIDSIVKSLSEAPTAPDPPPLPPVESIAEQKLLDTLSDEEPLELTPPPRLVAQTPTEVAESLPPPPASGQGIAQDASPWNPRWSVPDEPKPLAAGPTSPLSPSPAEMNAPQVSTQTAPSHEGEPNDRELLAALLEALDRHEAEPRASGPRSASDRYAGFDAETRNVSEALYQRGYRGLSLHHVRSLLSEDPEDRLRLIERLLVEATGDTAKLLLLLAYDEHAEVRAAALTALAASPRRELVEASWEIAINDPDPRVGRLAESIGARLR